MRAWLIVLWGCVCAAVFGAPILQARGLHAAGSFLYAMFSSVCHQDPSRSFFLLGHPCAVCHRCSGIYLGLLLVSLLPRELRMVRGTLGTRRLWVACAAAPMLLDALLPFAGLWVGSAVTRAGTGLLFGSMLSSFVAPALAELADRPLWRNSNREVKASGGLS